jgi:hypothetical protein
MNWNPNDQDIYAGLSGLKLPIEEFELGHGIVLSETYAHVFGPYMAAFKEAEKGKAHPAPWKAVGGGIAFDIWLELTLPKETTIFKNIDRLNTIWIIAALIRIKVLPFVKVPVISNIKFKEIATSKEEANFHPIEIRQNNLFAGIVKSYSFNKKEFEWIKDNLATVGSLFEKSEKFQTALLALDRAIIETRFSMALMTLWGALEQLFSPDDKQELSYRISLNIAAYLKPKGEERLLLFKSVRKLYTARSKAAHGNPTEDAEEFIQTYNILKEAFIKMTVESQVPTQTIFEKLIMLD